MAPTRRCDRKSPKLILRSVVTDDPVALAAQTGKGFVAVTRWVKEVNRFAARDAVTGRCDVDFDLVLTMTSAALSTSFHESRKKGNGGCPFSARRQKRCHAACWCGSSKSPTGMRLPVPKRFARPNRNPGQFFMNSGGFGPLYSRLRPD